MKHITPLVFLLLVHFSSSAQLVKVLKGDSILFTNDSNRATELIIENHSQGISGFLFNKGRGRTEFRHAFIGLNDTLYLVGSDTFRVPSPNFWIKNGNAILNTNTGNVGIHRLSPNAMLDLPGTVNVDDTSSYRMNDTVVLRMDGLTSGSYTNLYLGPSTGTGNTGKSNTYLGPLAGGSLVAGDANTFVGSVAGQNYLIPGMPSGRNTFAGALAAANNSGSDLVVVGIDAADMQYGWSTISIGNAASTVSGSKTNCIMIGDVAGTSAEPTNTNLSTYIGGMAGAVETKAQNSNTLIGASTSIITGPSFPPSTTSNTTAIGYQATARTSNTMVFGDASVNTWLFNSGATTVPGAVLVVGSNSTNGNGAYLTKGGVWTNTSDRHKKENFTSLDEADLLYKIDQLPVTRWNYKGQSDKHIGPIAQDFYQLFQLGGDDKTISTIDPAGIALGGIQGIYHRWQQSQLLSVKQLHELVLLQQKIQEQQTQLDQLSGQLESQEAELARQDEEFLQLAERINGASKTQQN